LEHTVSESMVEVNPNATIIYVMIAG
jgi:hypothetical protein